MRLLLLSNSTNPGEEYLGWGREHIKSFLGDKPVNAVFIPYAAVTFSYDEYESKVGKVFAELGYNIKSIHHAWDPAQAIEEADAIVIGGGNTWKLFRELHEKELMPVIKAKVEKGTPYLGWSAGSNVACPTLKTTNDMPITEPLSFHGLNLVPFQINPHFLDAHPEGHGGETREDRIKEFIEINPDVFVVGLREACLLKYEENELKLIGNKTARIFRKDWITWEIALDSDLSFLLEDNRIPTEPYC